MKNILIWAGVIAAALLLFFWWKNKQAAAAAAEKSPTATTGTATEIAQVSDIFTKGISGVKSIWNAF